MSLTSLDELHKKLKLYKQTRNADYTKPLVRPKAPSNATVKVTKRPKKRKIDPANENQSSASTARNSSGSASLKITSASEAPRTKFSSIAGLENFTLSSEILSKNISEYKLLQRVGEGSYGVVYKAKHRKNNQIYAIKRLKPIKSFTTHLREINALRRIKQHENVVFLYDVVVGSEHGAGHSASKAGSGDVGTTFLVLDFCLQDLGVILDKHSAESPAFLMPHVKALIKQIFRGIGFLHANSIIHRDVKVLGLGKFESKIKNKKLISVSHQLLTATCRTLEPAARTPTKSC